MEVPSVLASLPSYVRLSRRPQFSPSYLAAQCWRYRLPSLIDAVHGSLQSTCVGLRDLHHDSQVFTCMQRALPRARLSCSWASNAPPAVPRGRRKALRILHNQAPAEGHFLRCRCHRPGALNPSILSRFGAGGNSESIVKLCSCCIDPLIPCYHCSNRAPDHPGHSLTCDSRAAWLRYIVAGIGTVWAADSIAQLLFNRVRAGVVDNVKRFPR